MITLFFTILFDMAHEEGKNVLILRTRNVQAMDISGPEALEAVFKLCQKGAMTLILSYVDLI